MRETRIDWEGHNLDSERRTLVEVCGNHARRAQRSTRVLAAFAVRSDFWSFAASNRHFGVSKLCYDGKIGGSSWSYLAGRGCELGHPKLERVARDPIDYFRVLPPARPHPLSFANPGWEDTPIDLIGAALSVIKLTFWAPDGASGCLQLR
jgi:hypothetical protein